ncbi:MAG: hypothetical protein KJZ76_15990 [Burkholderiaceae bacterium]|nr:hypothetical protein [Burkholderiaceae bacterium]
MNQSKSLPYILLLLITALQLTACSKTVQWEEEVPLNTGETIWVKRGTSYSYKGAGGNPFDIGLRPDRTHWMKFEWKGTRYTWEGDASLMLLAIDSKNRPVLVANAADGSWGDQKGYICIKPYYVQFVPDKPNKWTWPSRIDPWLYGLHANLMVGVHYVPEEVPKHISSAHRAEFNADMWHRQREARYIDAEYIPDFCKGRV